MPDAVADGFGGVVFPVVQLARFITAKGLVGERMRVGDRFGPDFGIVGMQGGVEPEEAPPREEEAVVGQALQFGRRERKDRLKTLSGVGLVRRKEVGEL